MKQLVLLALTLFTALPAIGVPSQEADAAVSPEVLAHVDRVIAGLPATLERTQQGIDDALEQIALEEKRKKEEKITRIKWQNTLVGERANPEDTGFDMPFIEVKESDRPWADTIPLHIPMDLYNRDLVKGGSILLKASGTYYLFNRLYQERTKHVFTTFCDNPQAALTMLEELKKAEIADEQAHTQKNFLQRRFFRKNTPETDKAAKILKDEHRFVGYNPFKKVLAPAFVGVMLTAYLANQVKKRLLINDPWQAETWQRFTEVANDQGELEDPISFEEWENTSDSEVAGIMALAPLGDLYRDIPKTKLVELEKEPLSLMPLGETAIEAFQNPLNIIKYPFYVIGDYVGDNLGGMKIKEKVGSFLLPQCPEQVWKALDTGANVALLGAVIKERDRVYDGLWNSYLKKNREEAEKLVIAYQEAKNNHETLNDSQSAQSLKEAESALMNFIQKGHRIRSWNPGIVIKQWLRTTPPSWLTAAKFAVGYAMGVIASQRLLGKTTIEVQS